MGQPNSQQRFFIVGGAGFIGSHFCDHLLGPGGAAGVTLYDNFSSGRPWHYAQHEADPRFRVVRGEVEDGAALAGAMDGHDVVIHLASNPDIARAAREPTIDFTQGTSPSHYSNFYLAVSQGNDARGGWYQYKFDMTKDGNTSTNNWGDYEALGMSDDKIAFTSQQFSFANSYQYQKIRILDRALVYTAITFRFGLFNPIARLFLPAYTRIVIDQDVAIMKNQTANLERYAGRRFNGTEADLIHRFIESLRDHALGGEADPPPEPSSSRISFWM